MWSIEDVSAEELARLFHHYRGALAHDFDCSSSAAEDVWERTPQQERKLMIAAARLALLELATTPSTDHGRRNYFSAPGEAEWGC